MGLGPDDSLLLTRVVGEERRRIVGIDLLKPGREHWRTILKDTDARQLRGAWVHGDDLLIAESVDGVTEFSERPVSSDDTSLRVKPLDGPVQYVSVGQTMDAQALVRTVGPAHNRTWIRTLDGGYTEMTSSRRAPVVFESVLATSADGTSIPVSWARSPKLNLDANAPVWLRAYGGFGQSQSLRVGAAEEIWLAAGGVLAVVHARGGAERGEEWHEQAMGENLGRTFEDVIAAAQWFVDAGWSRHGRIAVSGTSNGGLTAMASVAERPDLFGAGVSHSGVHDLVGGRSLEGGWWPAEYGRPGNADERRVMERYSPVARSPKSLPPILITTGREDPTVPPMHSHRLMNAWEGVAGGPVLIRVYPWTSHSMHLGRKAREEVSAEISLRDRDRAAAEELEFLLRSFDMKVLNLAGVELAVPVHP